MQVYYTWKEIYIANVFEVLLVVTLGNAKKSCEYLLILWVL